MRLLEIFRTPDAVTLAHQELRQAEVALLEHQSNCEYSLKMREYYKLKTSRLRQYVQEVRYLRDAEDAQAQAETSPGCSD